MRTFLNKLSTDQARAELLKHTRLGWLFPVVGLIAFGWLGALGVMFGARALLLTFHAGNKSIERLWLHRLIAVLVLLLGWFDMLFLRSHGLFS